MKRILLVPALILLCICSSYSQIIEFQKLDYDKIEAAIKDSSSHFFYPKLMEKLEASDTTLTNEDYKYLYYGYVFQKDYKPYWISPYEEGLKRYFNSSEIDKKDYDKIIQIATKTISMFPFDLRTINMLVYMYRLKGDEEMTSKTMSKFHGIMNAILSTVDGETCETGFHVITVSHEYVILNMFQLEMKSQSLTGDCDYLELKKNKQNIEGIYFDISRPFKSLSKNFE